MSDIAPDSVQPQNSMWNTVSRKNQKWKDGGNRSNQTNLVVSLVAVGTKGMQITQYFIGTVHRDLLRSS